MKLLEGARNRNCVRLNISTFCSEFVEILPKDFQFPCIEPVVLIQTLLGKTRMIEGTRSYRRKNFEPIVDEKSLATSAEGTECHAPNASNFGAKTSAPPAEDPRPEPDAAIQSAESPATTTLNRRAWFSSLVPAFGDGLVKLLRASNNLKDDLNLRS